MPDLTMGAIESRFADIIWNNEPISSGQLAQESLRLLGWKKSTSFTVLRRLCEKGIFQNQKGTVTSQPLKQTEQGHFGTACLLTQLFQGQIAYFPWMVAYICDDLLLLAGEHPIRRVEILVEQNRKIDQTYQPLSW